MQPVKTKKGYDVITRPAGGSIIGCVCSDAQAHFFAYVNDKPQGGPACGAALEFGTPAVHGDLMCESCAIAAEAWARGGALYMEKS